MEEMTGNISLKGSWVECGALAVRASAEAYGGLVIQVQPDPLGVPAIGENEYVWTGDVPAELGIDAAAMVHTWGWDGADTAWLASEVSFRTEPEIPTDYTKPGILTVARGSLLVAQSEVDGNMQDGLVYKSDRLPPRNSDFGKKRVLLASKQGPVDYAEVEVFYPADSKNHPPGGPPGWEAPTYPCSPSVATETPNWFFYYCQAYSCRDIEYVNSDMSYACRTKAYIANSGSPSRGEWGVPLFILQERLDSCGRMRPLITQATYRIGEFMPWLDRLWVKGIHRFIALVEHERAHLDLWRMGIQVERGGANDRDHDLLHDDIEPQIGLDPCDRRSAACPLANEFPYGDPDGDADALAEIIAYGRLLMAEALWRMDWAENGLQFGRPVSPFPWRYSSNNSNYPSRTDLLTNIPSTQYSHCQCPQVRR